MKLGIGTPWLALVALGCDSAEACALANAELARVSCEPARAAARHAAFGHAAVAAPTAALLDDITFTPAAAGAW